MGGYAFGINGQLDQNMIKSFEEKSSLFGKLFGERVTRWPKIIDRGNGAKGYELYTKDIEKRLTEEFYSFVKNIPSPWPATKTLIESYLSLDVFSIYIRGDQEKPEVEPEWYIQFSFSGCAGMAETSAMVASHFVEHWYKSNKSSIDQILVNEMGFDPTYQEADPKDQNYFFPIAELGYVLYTENSFYLSSEDDIDDDEPEDEDEFSCHFDIDAGCVLTVDDKVDKETVYKIEEVITKYFKKNKRCFCQLCYPEFKPPTVSFS